MEGKNVKMERRMVSRALDELSPYDVWGLQECMRCGICRYACPFWLDSQKATDIPAWRTYEVNKVYSMYYTGYGNVARFLRLRRIKSSEFLKWRESSYNCTACGACTDVSPLEIPNWYTAILLRRMLHLAGMNLEEVEEWANNTKKLGNPLGISTEQWEETAKSAGLPLNEKADILYVPSALESREGEILQQVANSIIATGEKFTASSQISDVGYYSYLAGDFETARDHFTKILEIAKQVEAKKIVVSDGAGLFFLRWQAPKTLGHKIDIPIYHLTELIYDAYKKGKVKIEVADFKDQITVHDSEFMSKLGGVEKPPRELMKASIFNYREPKFSPSSHNLFTCGHHLELIKEKSDTVKRARAYSIKQLASWGESVVTFDPNCLLSMRNGIRDSQGIKNAYYYTNILDKAIKR
ncbi:MULTISPECIES: (Fe-S)-binding protein [Metallosphaera]|uniref:(Fe-S)-binding protein n=1 Tax=Metallosphaera TaxID=41980 RepID=UPI001F06E8B9|nr:(Fe-S)-binding protein [Metallosphaera sedula]MCH1771921.1 (Fe-S)-binding protein [Metallosphaera sedula]MCP6728557.1 (Fe-S)-binding protein [Metallosphaera sedula]